MAVWVVVGSVAEGIGGSSGQIVSVTVRGTMGTEPRELLIK